MRRLLVLALLALPAMGLAQVLDHTQNGVIGTVQGRYDEIATQILLQPGEAANFFDPAVYGAYNVAWYNTQYSPAVRDPNYEIVRITAISGDTLTVLRGQEDYAASTKMVQGKTYVIFQPATALWYNTAKSLIDSALTYGGTGDGDSTFTTVAIDSALYLKLISTNAATLAGYGGVFALSSDSLLYYRKPDGSTILISPDTSATGITNLNGLTSAAQTFAVPGVLGDSPYWSSSGSAHTLHIPLIGVGKLRGLVSAGTDTIPGIKYFFGSVVNLGDGDNTSVLRVWNSLAGNYGELAAGSWLSEARVYSLPDSSGTVALKEYVAALSHNQSASTITNGTFQYGDYVFLRDVTISGKIATDSLEVTQVTSDLIPDPSATLNLGALFMPWQSVYANRLHSDTLVSFNDDTVLMPTRNGTMALMADIADSMALVRDSIDALRNDIGIGGGTDSTYYGLYATNLEVTGSAQFKDSIYIYSNVDTAKITLYSDYNGALGHILFPGTLISGFRNYLLPDSSGKFAMDFDVGRLEDSIGVLRDSVDALRADIGNAEGITYGDTSTVIATHFHTDSLGWALEDTAAAIRADFPTTGIADSTWTKASTDTLSSYLKTRITVEDTLDVNYLVGDAAVVVTSYGGFLLKDSSGAIANSEFTESEVLTWADTSTTPGLATQNDIAGIVGTPDSTYTKLSTDTLSSYLKTRITVEDTLDVAFLVGDAAVTVTTTPGYVPYDSSGALANSTMSLNGSAITQAGPLIVSGTTAYLRAPSLTTTQRNALSAADGMVIHNSTLDSMQIYDASAWRTIGAGGGSSAFADSARASGISDSIRGRLLIPFDTTGLSAADSLTTRLAIHNDTLRIVTLGAGYLTWADTLGTPGLATQYDLTQVSGLGWSDTLSTPGLATKYEVSLKQNTITNLADTSKYLEGADTTIATGVATILDVNAVKWALEDSVSTLRDSIDALRADVGGGPGAPADSTYQSMQVDTLRDLAGTNTIVVDDSLKVIGKLSASNLYAVGDSTGWGEADSSLNVLAVHNGQIFKTTRPTGTAGDSSWVIITVDSAAYHKLLATNPGGLSGYGKLVGSTTDSLPYWIKPDGTAAPLYNDPSGGAYLEWSDTASTPGVATKNDVATHTQSASRVTNGTFVFGDFVFPRDVTVSGNVNTDSLAVVQLISDLLPDVSQTRMIGTSFALYQGVYAQRMGTDTLLSSSEADTVLMPGKDGTIALLSDFPANMADTSKYLEYADTTSLIITQTNLGDELSGFVQFGDTTDIIASRYFTNLVRWNHNDSLANIRNAMLWKQDTTSQVAMQWELDNHTQPASRITAGTFGAGIYAFPSRASAVDTFAVGESAGSGAIKVQSTTDGYWGIISPRDALTAERKLAIPDSSGTIALVEYLPSGAADSTFRSAQIDTIYSLAATKQVVVGDSLTVVGKLSASNLYGIGDSTGFSTKDSLYNVLAVHNGQIYAVERDERVLQFAVSDDSTTITAKGPAITFRMPFKAYITRVRASLKTASSSGVVTFDINEAGTTILSTKLTIDQSELTSQSALNAAVISDRNIADDASMTVDVDGAGTGAVGAKISIYYRIVP